MLMRDAAVLVVCDAPFGPGNIANLELALEAARGGKRTLVLEQVPIDERDFTGGQAAALWRVLRERAAVFDSVEAVLHTAQEILRDLTVAER